MFNSLWRFSQSSQFLTVGSLGKNACKSLYKTVDWSPPCFYSKSFQKGLSSPSCAPSSGSASTPTSWWAHHDLENDDDNGDHHDHDDVGDDHPDHLIIWSFWSSWYLGLDDHNHRDDLWDPGHCDGTHIHCCRGEICICILICICICVCISICICICVCISICICICDGPHIHLRCFHLPQHFLDEPAFVYWRPIIGFL